MFVMTPLDWIKCIVAFILGFFLSMGVDSIVDTVSPWLGIQTKSSLKVENTVLKNNQEKLTEANTGLAKHVDVQTKTTGTALDSSKKANAAVTVIDKKTKEIEVRLKQTDIIAATSLTPEGIAPVAVSRERITAIWEHYCHDDPEIAESCAQQLTVEKTP